MINWFFILRRINISILLAAIFLSSCTEKKEVIHTPEVPLKEIKKPELKIVYKNAHIKSRRILGELKEKFGDTGMRQVLALNRMDTRHIVIGDSICIPDTLPDDWFYFSPFPEKITALDSIPKILIFSYSVQAFAAYENGKLIRWGPTSLGKRSTPTPLGLYFTNWKAKETISTVNDEWILPWAFNIDNLNGISIHQFELPGYPASHSCARLLQQDAEWIYYWAEQWILSKDGSRAKASGTPVIIYGKYNFRSPPPWKLLPENSDADKIDTLELNSIVKDYLPEIIERKNQRDSLLNSMRKDSTDKRE